MKFDIGIFHKHRTDGIYYIVYKYAQTWRRRLTLQIQCREIIPNMEYFLHKG